MRLCRADQAVIFRQDNGVYRFAAGYSVNPEYLEIERQNPILPGPETVVGRAALSRSVAQIDDAWTDPLYQKKRDAKIAGVRSMIGVPLMREGEPIGVIALARGRVEPFVEREIELVDDVCRPGGHRDRECAAVRSRTAAHARTHRIAGAADRDVRGAARHQLVRPAI